jgi:5-methylcytosine-specific restriction protein B
MRRCVVQLGCRGRLVQNHRAMATTETTSTTFTWIPFYEELADKLVPYRKRQRELVTLLEDLRASGCKITPMNDRDTAGRRFLLEEIDPFTFFGTFNRGITNDNRLAILGSLKSFFGIDAPVPSDFNGVPVLNNQKSWFISYQRNRKPDDVECLWEVFELALAPEPMANPKLGPAFDRALEVRGVNFNLTQGLFWVRPRVFVSLDRTMRSYLDLPPLRGGLSFKVYVELRAQALERATNGIAALSHEAWLNPPGVEPEDRDQPEHPQRDIDHWFVGAYWDSQSPQDQTARFLAECVWENGYDDKFLDQVRAMKVGDKIAIKASSTLRDGLPFDARGNTVSRLTIKARGEITHNPGDGRSVEVEWEPDFAPRDWYFYTSRQTVWRMRKDEDLARLLVDFAFRDKPQDYPYFVNRWYGTETKPIDDGGELDTAPPYSVEDMLAEGVFLTRPEIETALSRLKDKKNIVLQGAPGVGKTFVATKLAYALIEASDPTRVHLVQFHPSYSYEDFVRGYRPTGQAGGFELRDGPFLRVCQRADADPDRAHVLIIDEINRGNLSQVFGELFMLLEADKRGSKHATTPLYRRSDDEQLTVPGNLFVIGTMNIADRSLALVDFALRRRFAFLTLEPRFGDPAFRHWLLEREMSEALVTRIVRRMADLNERIAGDPRLGPAFRVGHSFFCPRGDEFSTLGDRWFEEVVETEIAPLLREYWYDEADKANGAVEQLLAH